jgi:aminoglycoside phosphotransferase (APT) family kinase protein
MAGDPPGPELGNGRDCAIYALDDERILRRARDGRTLEAEADLMRHVHERGYPVPRVFEAGGPDIVMERVDGPTLIEYAVRRPWRLRSCARLLARLHHQLAAVPAPDWLTASTRFPGDDIVHFDLHPLNVLVGPRGPAVIDWARARRGPAGADVASTWMLVASGELPGSAVSRVVAGAARRQFLASFLNEAGRAGARPWLAAVAEERAHDRNLRPAELDRMRRLAARQGGTQ